MSYWNLSTNSSLTEEKFFYENESNHTMNKFNFDVHITYWKSWIKFLKYDFKSHKT